MKVLLVNAIICTVIATAAAACARGDIPCHCRAVGGVFRQGRPPVIPSCRVYYKHQGRQRYAHVYLPSSYDGSRTFPLWMHLHGVFWNTMGGIGKKVGPINGTDIIPVWDTSVSQFGGQAILVYPQSTGDAGRGEPSEGQGATYRQFWACPFWRCSVGICADGGVDDVGFIETVLLDVSKRLPVSKGQIFLSGLSAGGMMVEALLCQSVIVAQRVAAAADILGGIAKDYALGTACRNSLPVPFMKLQGMADPFITFDREVLVDGVNFISSIDAAKLRAVKNGCTTPTQHAGPWVTELGGSLRCKDFCARKLGAFTAKVCGMAGVGHDTDHPWPGFVFQQAWRFFNEQLVVAGTKRGRGGGGLAGNGNATRGNATGGGVRGQQQVLLRNAGHK